MDTRSKIISAAEAQQRLQSEAGLLPVIADLDPPYAPHAAALQQFGRPLLLLLTAKPDSYLSLAARAEMAASFAAVRYVVPCDSPDLPIATAHDLRPQEALWRADLESLVLRKSAIPEAPARS